MGFKNCFIVPVNSLARSDLPVSKNNSVRQTVIEINGGKVDVYVIGVGYPITVIGLANFNRRLPDTVGGFYLTTSYWEILESATPILWSVSRGDSMKLTRMGDLKSVHSIVVTKE